jgi:hypothetical protein
VTCIGRGTNSNQIWKSFQWESALVGRLERLNIRFAFDSAKIWDVFQVIVMLVVKWLFSSYQ